MVAKQVRVACTQEFRLAAVRFVQSGQYQMQVCQTLGFSKASLGSWVRQVKVGTLKLGVADAAASKVTLEQMEISRRGFARVCRLQRQTRLCAYSAKSSASHVP